VTSCWEPCEEGRSTDLTGDLVQLDAQEPAAPFLFEMHRSKLTLLDHLLVEPSLELHHVKQHLVVGPAGEEDLARVELEECAADGPDVERAVVRQAKDWREIDGEIKISLSRVETEGERTN
jgi:hypothetical protein